MQSLPSGGPAPTPPPVEIELKLGLPAEAAAHVLRHPCVKAAARGRARRERLFATYFDTPDLALAKGQVALRIRREGGRWVQTIKGPPPAGAHVSARTEIECALGESSRRPPLSHAALLATPWRALLEPALRDKALVPQFATDYERTSLPLAFADGTRAVLCIDVGEARALARPRASRRVPLSEVEIELRSGDPRPLYGLAAALATDLPLVPEPASKAERGYALVAPGLGAPQRAPRTTIADGASAAVVLAQVVGECLQQIERNLDGAREGRDPEYAHQLRVGARRLRCALALARPHVPAEPLAHLAAETRWLAQALGEVRELDVLVADTLASLAREVNGDASTWLAPAVATLREAAGTRREAAQREAGEALHSSRCLRLLLALGAWRAAPALGAEPGSAAADALAAPIKPFAQHVLARRYRKLVRTGDRIAEATAEERHALRIAAKRLRYACEFFASAFPGGRVRSFVAALAALQDVLGADHDEAVALAWSARLAGAQAPATFALAGWTLARARRRRRTLLKAWARVAKARAFWR